MNSRVFEPHGMREQETRDYSGGEGSRAMHHSGKPAESFAVKFLTDLWEKPDSRNHRTWEGGFRVKSAMGDDESVRKSTPEQGME